MTGGKIGGGGDGEKVLPGFFSSIPDLSTPAQAMQAIPRQEVKFFFPGKTGTFSTYPFLGYFQNWLFVG